MCLETLFQMLETTFEFCFSLYSRRKKKSKSLSTKTTNAKSTLPFMSV